MLGFGSGCAAEDDGGRAFIYLERSDSPCSLAEIAGRPYLGASSAHIDETVGHSSGAREAGRAGAPGLAPEARACGAARASARGSARQQHAWLTGGALRTCWALWMGMG